MYIGTLNFLPTDYLYVGRISECSTTLFRIFEIARTSALVQQLVVFNARVLRSPTSLQNDVCCKTRICTSVSSEIRERYRWTIFNPIKMTI